MIGKNTIHNNDRDRDRPVVGSFKPVDDSRTVGSGTTRDTIYTTSEDRIVESIYNHVMQSICRDVAANMHEMIKTGSEDVIPSSWKLFTGTKTPTRRELYPELYNGSDGNSDNETSSNDNTTETTGEGGHRTNKSTTRKRMTDEEIESILDKYAVDLPISSPSASPTTDGKRRLPRDMAKEEEDRRLLSKIKKEKESKYKHDSEEDEDDIPNNNDDEDDEDFKMDDADGENDDDDDENLEGTRKKKRALSSLSTTPSVGSTAEPGSLSTAPAGVADPTTTTTTTTTTAAAATSSGNHSGVGHPKVDIWGKTPSKEPKNRLCRCQLCGRLVSTSRFASHLDKCMGLSTSRGGPSSISGSLGSTKSMLLSSTSGMSGLGLKKTKRGSTILK